MDRELSMGEATLRERLGAVARNGRPDKERGDAEDRREEEWRPRSDGA